MMGELVARGRSWLARAIAPEGAWRPAYGVSELGGVFPVNFGNGWERGLRLVDGRSAGNVPAAYAAVMANARAVSQCTPKHVRISDTGKHETVTTSPASRLLVAPNEYESFCLFISNVVAALGFEGEALAVILRDASLRPVELHRIPRGYYQPRVDTETGAVFYSVGTSPMRPTAESLIIPARDVLHFRLHTPRHPLIGESPIVAAALAAGINVALSETQAAFFSNMARPSGILSTDQQLTKDQMLKLRESFEAQSVDMARGKLPILGNGLKFHALSVNSVDAEFILAHRLSIEDIARCYGVPPPVIGDLSHATLQNTETLINFWLAIALGALLESIERTLERGFRFNPSQDYIELDADALLRTDTPARIEALAKGVQGGIYTVNEARTIEGLDPKPQGDEPLLQEQMTPLSKLGKLADSRTAPKPAPAPPSDPPKPGDQATQRALDPATMAALVRGRLGELRNAA